MSSSTRRARIGLTFVLLLSVAFAGCFGDEDVPEPTDAASGGTGDPGTGTDPVPSPGDATDEVTQNSTERVPEAHYHHYWGNPALDKILVFDGTVSLDHEECLRADSRQRPPCFGQQAHVGSVIFDLESDGDQVNEQSQGTHLEGHADTIFTGTSAIEATFSWDDALVGSQLRFYYKPANFPGFLPNDGDPSAGGAPIFVTKDDPTIRIDVGPGMADPAHQFWVSRWAFMLVAEGGPQEEWAAPVKFAHGDVRVEMTAINGGKASIDPPHPDRWANGDVLRFGSVTGDFEITSARASTDDGQIDQRVVFGDGFEDIEMPVKAVVPAGAEKLVVRAWVNATNDLPEEMDWGLKYHGANTLTYTRVSEHTAGEAGERVYEIFIGDAEADPAYESRSYFRFGFYPILADQAETGTFSADYTLAFEAHKSPDFTYYY